MALKDSIAKHSFRTSDSCPITRLKERLTKEDQAALDEAMKTNVAIYAIARALRSEGHRIAETSIGDHMKKVCRCFAK